MKMVVSGPGLLMTSPRLHAGTVHHGVPRAALDSAMDAVAEAIVITEPSVDQFEATIVYVNRAFARLTGFSVADAIGRNLKVLFGPKTARTALGRMLAQVGTHGSGQIDSVHYRKDGQEFLGRWCIQPLFDSAGSMIHMLYVLEDITERQRTQLAASRLSAVVESLQAAVLLVGPDQAVLYANPAMAALVGTPQCELMGRFVHQLSCFTPKTSGHSLSEVLNQLVPAETWRGELDLVGVGGQHIVLDGSVSTVWRGAMMDVCYAVVGRDITSQRRLEAVASALNMTENTGYIFAGIRHELGNPVNSLKTALTVVRSNIQSYSRDKLADYCDRMIEEVGRMEYLLGSLKSVSPSTSVSLQRVDVVAFLAKFVPLVTRDLQSRGIALSVQYADDQVLILANAGALHQVLINLINNAADAVVNVVKPAICVSANRFGEEVEITVSDNGCGMTQQQQDCLFKPFHTSKPHGTGLGLVITQRLVAQMNGTLSIASQRGNGARVVISFECSPP